MTNRRSLSPPSIREKRKVISLSASAACAPNCPRGRKKKREEAPRKSFFGDGCVAHVRKRGTRWSGGLGLLGLPVTREGEGSNQGGKPTLPICGLQRSRRKGGTFLLRTVVRGKRKNTLFTFDCGGEHNSYHARALVTQGAHVGRPTGPCRTLLCSPLIPSIEHRVHSYFFQSGVRQGHSRISPSASSSPRFLRKKYLASPSRLPSCVKRGEREGRIPCVLSSFPPSV